MGKKIPRSQSPVSPAPTVAGSQGTRRGRARRGCFGCLLQDPRRAPLHATISTDSGKNPHYPPRPEIPTLGMSQGGEGRCCWGGGGAEVQPPRSPGPSRSGASNQGPPSSGCRSNLALILHAPGHWPAATDPHSGAWSLLPLRSGGFQRTVCAMETVARGGRSEGRRLEGVCDPRGARAGGRRVGGRRRRAWK